MPAPSIVHLECGLGLAALRHEHPIFPITIDGLRFSIDEADRADWLVAMSYIRHDVTTRVPLERRILVITEPSGNFTPAYLNQFGILVSPFTIAGYRGNWVQSHGALGLYFRGGVGGEPLAFDALVNLPAPRKHNIITVVVSRKSILPGHRQRLRFLRTLRRSLGGRLLIYGRGFHPINDKAEAILPAKYHLVLENTLMPSYWTEKLADAYVGYALPIVSGPPDLDRWFPPDSFVPIDIEDPDGATAVIVQALDGDIYANHFNAVVEARTRLLRNERLCPLVARVIAGNPSSTPSLTEAKTLGPTPRAPIMRRVGREVVRFYWQMEERIRHRLAEKM